MRGRADAVDNEREAGALVLSARELGLSVSAPSAERLLAFEHELLDWNQKVNLVSRATASEARERHLLDSLAALPDLEGARQLLDIGSGGGLPGIPLKIARPELRVTLAESIGKKAAFLRSAARRLHLGDGLAVRQVRAQGNPAREGLPLADAVISRGLTDVSSWLKLAVCYLLPAGRVLAMVARVDEAALQQAAAASGLRLTNVRRYALPLSGDPRAIARFDR
jgi:16S rRNA (guanine527-N7)-methyltransferase